MSRNVFLAGGAGAVAALFWLGLGSTMPGALILVQIPLFAMGLAWGMVPTVIAGGTALAIVLTATSITGTGLFALIAIVPVLLLLYFTLQSRPGPDGGVEWYPTGFVMAWLSALALGYLLAAGLYLSDPDGGLEGAASNFLQARLTAILVEFPADKIEAVVSVVTQFFPATALGIWQVTVIIAGLLAQGLVSRFGRNLRSFTPFSAFMLPQWLGYLLVACVIGSLARGQIGYLGQNGAILVAIPFFFLGLSVIHAVSRGRRGREFGLPVLYLLMMLLGWPTLIVAGLGFVEQWFGLRGRYATQPKDQEED
jgi:hypothetical protein